jgi:hypothetical protein
VTDRAGVVLVDGPAAGRIVDVDPLRRMVTVSLGSRRVEHRFGDVTVEVELHDGLATYLRDERGEWRHVETPLAIGDGVDIAAGRKPCVPAGARERGEEETS